MIVRDQPIFTYLILGPGCVKLENPFTQPVNREYRTDIEKVRHSYHLFSPGSSMPNWLGEEEKDAFM